ncbi:MAG: ABC transporter permease [Actinomycetota bacterium]
MSEAGLTVRQVGFTNRAFWRNPPAAFFTFAFPLMFLVIFTSLFSDTTDVVIGGVLLRDIPTASYYIPAIATFSIITATYTNLAISVTFLRELGILKRVRGTPMPAGTYLTARIIHAVFLAILLVVIVTVFGVLFYDANVTLRTLPSFAATVAVGAASFSALGLALTSVISNADASPAVVNASVLPLLFLSGVFIPLTSSNAWYVWVAKIFPIYHFTQAMLNTFLAPTGSGFQGWDLLIMGAWGVVGLLLAIRFFTWEPRNSA